MCLPTRNHGPNEGRSSHSEATKLTEKFFTKANVARQEGVQFTGDSIRKQLSTERESNCCRIYVSKNHEGRESRLDGRRVQPQNVSGRRKED